MHLRVQCSRCEFWNDKIAVNSENLALRFFRCFRFSTKHLSFKELQPLFKFFGFYFHQCVELKCHWHELRVNNERSSFRNQFSISILLLDFISFDICGGIPFPNHSEPYSNRTYIDFILWNIKFQQCIEHRMNQRITRFSTFTRSLCQQWFEVWIIHFYSDLWSRSVFTKCRELHEVHQKNFVVVNLFLTYSF